MQTRQEKTPDSVHGLLLLLIHFHVVFAWMIMSEHDVIQKKLEEHIKKFC